MSVASCPDATEWHAMRVGVAPDPVCTRVAIDAVRMNEIIKQHALRFTHKLATRKLLKAVPVLGAVFAATLAYRKVQEKGLARGAVDTALDLTPIVGRIKALTEIFTGDLIRAAPGERANENKALTKSVVEAAA